MPRFLSPVLVFTGGALGTWVRVAVFQFGETAGLITVNAVGTLILATLSGLLAHAHTPRVTPVKLFVGAGICGSLTTQSTLALMTVQAGVGGLTLTLVSLVTGLCAAVSGWLIGSALRPSPRSSC